MILSDTANFRSPHYHKPTDTADKIDAAKPALIKERQLHDSDTGSPEVQSPMSQADSKRVRPRAAGLRVTCHPSSPPAPRIRALISTRCVSRFGRQLPANVPSTRSGARRVLTKKILAEKIQLGARFHLQVALHPRTAG